MKKYLMAVTTAVLMLLGVVGCGKEGAGENEIHAEAVMGQIKGGQETTVKNDNNDGDAGIQILTNINSATASCMNESGYYYITEDYTELEDESYGQHLMYMDFATQQEVYLCSTAGCSHRTRECTSVLSEEEFGNDSRIFCRNNALYILSREYDQDGVISMDLMGESSGDKDIQGTPTAIYRMNLDGTLRKKVYEFDAGLTLENIVLGDDMNLYFIEKVVETRQMSGGNALYTSAADRKIIKLDPLSWNAETVYQFEADSDERDWSVIGSFDESLVLSGVVYNHALSDEEMLDDDVSTENLKKAVIKYAVLNLADGTIEIIDSASYPADRNMDCAVKDEFLYLSEQGEGCIRQIDLKTGEEAKLAELENNRIWWAFDDVLCCTSWGDDYSLYFVSRKDGTVSHSPLVNQSLGWMLEFVGETENQFLVIYDYEATANGDGSYEIHRYCYGLISKEDLYNGSGSYVPIEMIGKGR